LKFIHEKCKLKDEDSENEAFQEPADAPGAVDVVDGGDNDDDDDGGGDDEDDDAAAEAAAAALDDNDDDI
jgi:hypothetical protein